MAETRRSALGRPTPEGAPTPVDRDDRPRPDHAAPGDALGPVFALPSGTTLRFVLLIVAVAASAALIYYLFAPPGLLRLAQAHEQCAATTPEPAPTGGTFTEWGAAQQQRAAGIDTCLLAYQARQVPWILGGLALLAAVTGLLYRLAPWWRIRRRRLTRLTRQDWPELVDHLDAMMHEVGITHPPAFLLDPANPAVSGVAFGRGRQRYVCLAGGLVSKYTTDRATFRAVVLHELAHVRNNDIPRTYLTIALWRAFVVAALVPLVVVVGPQVPAAPGFVARELGWPILALTALVYLMRNAVLRSRELHADVRAAGWAPDSGALRRLFTRPPRPSALRWLDVVRSHPRPADRLHAVEHPSVLFRLGFWDMLGAGLAVGVAFSHLLFFTMGVLRNAVPAVYQGGPQAVMLAPLVAGVLGLSVWRVVAYARAADRPVPGALAPGAGFGIGVLLAPRMSLLGLGTGGSGGGTALAGLREGTEGGRAAAIGLPLLGVLATVLLVGWIRGCAQAWWPHARPGEASPRAPRWRWPLGLAVTAIVVTAGLAWWFRLSAGYRAYRLVASSFAASVRAGLEPVGWTGPSWLWSTVWNPVASAILPADDLVLAAVVLVWLFPVVAHLRSGTPALRFALRAGAVAGAGAALLMLAVRAAAHAATSPAARTTPVFVLLLSYWQIALAVLVQAAVAAVVAGMVAGRAHPRGGAPAVVFGLLGAFVTAALSAAGMAAGVLGGGCLPALAIRPTSCPGVVEGDWLGSVLRMVIVEGALAALGAGLLGVAAAAGLRLLGRLPGLPRSGQPRAERRPCRPVGPVGIVASAVLLTAVVAVFTWGALTPPAATSPDAMALMPAAPAASTVPPDPRVTAARAVREWLGNGGSARIEALRTDFEAVADAARRNDAPGARAACLRIAQDSERATALPAVPDTEASQAWSAALSGFRGAATACVTALDERDAALSDRAAQRMADAVTQYERFDRRVQEMLGVDQVAPPPGAK
jgi:Zn-dependent protease with chaperone function